MGRHATVAGRMAASAAQRGKVFTKLARELMVAARAGTDPSANSRLRMAIDKARENNMPKENIERAIKKGAGQLEGSHYEEIVYEGYGPFGTAFIIEVTTDNRNRTNPELRRIFQKNSGNLGEIGSVSWMFKRKGVLDILLKADQEDELMEKALDLGAEDVQVDQNLATVFTSVVDFSKIKQALIDIGFQVERSGLEMIPENFVAVPKDSAQQVNDLIEKLEDQDDVQNVFHNASFD